MLDYRHRWRREEYDDFTRFVGWNPAWEWVLYSVVLVVLVGPSVPALVILIGVVLLGLGRGFRLHVSDRGFRFVSTWFWVPYRVKRLPLTARCVVAEDDECNGLGVHLERSLPSEDVFFGTAENCWELQEAIVQAKHRWNPRA